MIIIGENEHFLGYDRERALEVFMLNYHDPNSKLPPILDPNGPNPSAREAPFIVQKHSPANNPVCRDVDWSKDILTQPMSSACRTAIGKYFEQYGHLEQHNSLARAWNPKNKNNRRAGRIRRYFNSNNTCSAAQFEMHEHPEYHKYIRKDRIPCAGCDL